MLLFLACTTPGSTATGGEVLTPLPDYSVDTGTPISDSGTDTADTEDPNPVYDEPEPPNLVINEVQTKNASTLFVDDDFPDWIELYNASAEAIDYSRISLTDDHDLPWIGPAGTSVEPGGYVLVYADGSVEGGMHAPYTLSKRGDHLTLRVDGYPTDRLATGDLMEDAAWGRFPDGGDWAPTITCSPGVTNGPSPSDSLDPGDALFDLSGINTVSLDMSSSAISSLKANGYADVQSDIAINGATFGPVDVRVRGSATRRTFGQKASLKVDLNSHVDVRYRGLEKLTIINMIWDPSYIREFTGYAIFREAGVPAARTSYTWLDVNGENYGLYLFTETYDDAFLRHWFGNSDGYMWEANGDFNSPSSWDCEEGYPCDTTNVSKVWSIVQNYDADEAGMEKMEEYVALDNMMREWVIENAIGQWDGYTSPHNYRVYENPTDGLMYMIPSSIDYTFDDPYAFSENIFYGNGQLMRWCWDTSACKSRYADVAREVADMIDEMDWDTRIDELRDVLDEHAGNDYDDPQGQYNHASYESQIEYIRTYIQEITDTMRDQAAPY